MEPYDTGEMCVIRLSDEKDDVVVVCLKPGETLTEEEQEELKGYFIWLRDKKRST